jgi:hypothetical protein
VSQSPAVELEELCTNCGGWVHYLAYNYDVGWCNECAGEAGQPTCTRCGNTLPHLHRSTCNACRQELWLLKYADELEFLIVTKGYTVHKAREVITSMVRPICRCCGKPITGAREGALFCKQDRTCHRAYNKFKRLQRAGLTIEQALAKIAEIYPREVHVTSFRITRE